MLHVVDVTSDNGSSANSSNSKWNTFNTDGNIEHRVHVISHVRTVTNVQRICTHTSTWRNKLHCMWHFGRYIVIILHKGLSKLTFRKMSGNWKTSHRLRNFIEIKILIYFLYTESHWSFLWDPTVAEWQTPDVDSIVHFFPNLYRCSWYVMPLCNDPVFQIRTVCWQSRGVRCGELGGGGGGGPGVFLFL